MLVLGVVAILGILMVEIVQQVDMDLQMAASEAKTFRALQLAESGLAFGLNPQIGEIASTDPLLHQENSDGEGFQVEIRGEGGRLNINKLLTSRSDDVFSRLFTEVGLNTREIAHLTDGLKDWVDDDDLQLLNGAEYDEYVQAGRRRKPSNRPFQSVEEMSYVMGMEPFMAAAPNWRDYFTVYGDGKLDLNEAPPLLIHAVMNVTMQQAESFVSNRDGVDGEKGTDDDLRVEQVEQVLGALYLTEKEYEAVSHRVTLEGSTRRITSRGKIGTFEKKITVIAQGQNREGGKILAWIEE